MHDFKDRHNKDIEAFSVPNRTWRPVRDSLIQFGGHRDGIKTVVSDLAPEFKRAWIELGVAPVEGTPGRESSHGIAGRVVRQALEY